jgi:enoyl-[acyl-carrier protein] reductase I
MLSLTYIASEVDSGYGGGMSSAKAQLESDTKVLSLRSWPQVGYPVNTISAGPLRVSCCFRHWQSPVKGIYQYAIDSTPTPRSWDLYSDDVAATVCSC